MTCVRHCRALVMVLLAASGALIHAAPLPASPSPHYIRDDAGWLGSSAFTALDAKLQQFERDTSSQYVVAIFPKIPEDEELFDFSQKLYETWKPGTREKDNGAIFLIFAANRKMRIHTGLGMEGVLPDARCKQIIEDVVAPKLRAGDKVGAINAAVDAMIAAAKGEYKGTGATNLDHQAPESGMGGILIMIVIGFILLRILTGRTGTALDVIFSVLGANRGGWSSGRSSGSWGGGGGSGGGGFSGGGGSSGGGGASGGW